MGVFAKEAVYKLIQTNRVRARARVCVYVCVGGCVCVCVCVRVRVCVCGGYTKQYAKTIQYLISHHELAIVKWLPVIYWITI